jgi:hypothetical protein
VPRSKLASAAEAEAEAATKAAATRQESQTALSDVEQRMAEMAKQAEQIQKRLGSS